MIRFALAALLLAAAPVAAQTPDARVTAAVNNSARPEAERARDQYRHPAETLAFFGLKPGMTVVEISPGAGWYANILAPAVAGGGQYIAIVPAPPQYQKATEALKARMAADPKLFGKPRFVEFTPDGKWAEGLNADMLLTFRNVHNWGDDAANMFKAFYTALKPGGVLGVVDHRLPESRTAPTGGYLKESDVIALATAAGFKLAGKSEVNANPKDTADYPKGVWTLPPTYALGDTDRAKYQAIGESDRMTLRFVKPKK